MRICIGTNQLQQGACGTAELRQPATSPPLIPRQKAARMTLCYMSIVSGPTNSFLYNL